MAKLIVQQFISTRSVISIITWLVLAMGIAILGSLYYFLQSIDDHASSELNYRVGLALELDDSHRKQYLEEYSHWDEAYDNIVLNYNHEWVNPYLQHIVNGNNNIDFSLAIENNDQLIYLSTNKNNEELEFKNIMQQGLAEMMTLSAKQDTALKSVRGYLALGQHIYVVVVAPFVNEVSDIPYEGSYLVFGKQIDDDYINHLARVHHLEGLKIHLSDDNEVKRKILYSPLGLEVGSLCWTESPPSDDTLPSIALILITFSLITLFITRQILHQEQTDRTAYEEKLFLEATQDPLTKINNRRYFMDMATKNFHLSKIGHHPFTVIIMDIDHFKNINDTFGHSTGDHILKNFSSICKNILRDGDVLARIGGEEFAILLPETSTDKAYEVANRIRLLIMETTFSIKADQISITVSSGISTLIQQEGFEDLIDEADQALYQAKHAGRNLVKVFSPN